MVRELGKYNNEVRLFSARFQKYDKFKNKMLLVNVQCIDGHSTDDHVWVACSNRLDKVDVAKCFTFKAMVTVYKRPRDNETDFTLRCIRDIKVI